MEPKPLVSVFCLTMNHSKYVERSFKSLVNQTFRDFEIIYLDNNSTDNTFEIADKILRESGLPYKSFRRTENFGIAANVNFLVKQTRGKYVASISGDDFWELSNLEEKINFFEQHPEFGMIYGNYFFYYYDTNTVVPNSTGADHLSGWVLKDLLKGNFINAVGTVFKKEVYEDVGPYDENSLIEDWDMTIRVAEKYPIGYHNKMLVYYGRTKSGNISSDFSFMEKAQNYIFRKYGHYPEIKKATSNFNLYKAYYYADNFPSWKTLKYLFQNFRFNFIYFKQIVKCILGMLGIKKVNNK